MVFWLPYMGAASVETKAIPARQEAAEARRTLWVTVLVALALSMVVVAFLYPGQLNPRRDHWPFGHETGRVVRAIASGRRFSDPLDPGSGSTAMMPPLYPYLVAVVFKAFGIFTKASSIILPALNNACSGLTCIPMFFIAEFSPPPATQSPRGRRA